MSSKILTIFIGFINNIKRLYDFREEVLEMKKLFNDLISDTSNVSSTRFVYVTGHIIIFVLSVYLVITNTLDSMNISLISILVGTLNSTKLIQKSQEVRESQKQSEKE